MQAERWQQIEALFNAAASRPPGDRAAYLDAHCDDPRLREEVEVLLAADDGAGAFLEEAVGAGVEALVPEAADARIGERFGPYRVLRFLGRGGISSVYLAVRDDAQYRKRVAIKLLRRGMDTDDILRRFRDERQILASLDHPNIARLLDGGTTGDGLPYFVMEHIDGLPIDEYCAQHGLTIAARIGLFQAVCAAVHVAHRNLVVHRDLKPSNILVTAEGVPKLLDFGIAKLLNPELTVHTLAPTAGRLRLMTPGYASPEQISGGPITTASDVYALGVLLYELLSGRRPHAGAASWATIERRVLEEEPERPSLAVERDTLRRALAGDLDNIVLKALRREPGRRYGSAEQLSEDLGRYLAGRPVIARSDTVGYRTAKFVLRHRWGVAAAAALVVMAIASAVVFAVQSARIRDERDRANQALALVGELFEMAEPRGRGGESITAVELLDGGADRVARLDDTADTARLLDTLARLYEDLTLYDKAVPLRRRALGIYQAAHGEVSREVAEELDELGRALALKGEFTLAEPLFRRALDLRRRIVGEHHPSLARSLNNLGLILHDLGDYRQARAFYEEGRALEERTGGPMPGSHLTSNLALLHHDMADYEAAEEIYRQLLAWRQRQLGREHPMVAYVHSYLGATLAASGSPAEAERHLRTALSIRLRRQGEQHREVARTRTQLGRLLCAEGRLEEGERLVLEARRQREAQLGEDHVETAATLEALAHCRQLRGEVAAAEGLYEQALGIYRKAGLVPHPETADGLLELGRLRASRGDCVAAIPPLEEALAARQAALPSGNVLIAQVREALSECRRTPP